MSNRLKKLASIISDEFSDNLTKIYGSVLTFQSENPDYFVPTFTANDTIKLVYYIYSLKKTDDFDFAEKIIPELHLAQFFDYNKVSVHQENCDNCDGDGNETCQYCDGNGQISCENCEGEGELDCWTCDGEGRTECTDCDGEGDIDGETCDNCSGRGDVECDTCGGGGKKTCNNCGGDGYESCDECNGNGSINCDYCDSDGQVDTLDFDYMINEYLVFDDDLVDGLYRDWQNNTPLGHTLEFKGRPTVLLINSRWEHGQFDPSVKEYEKYCFNISPFISTRLFYNRKGVGVEGITANDEPDTLLI
jgi:hypothetical protein